VEKNSLELLHPKETTNMSSLFPRRRGRTGRRARHSLALFAAERLEVRTAFTCNTPVQLNTLDPLTVHKYETALPNPLDAASVYKPSSVATVGGVRTENYTVGMYQTTQDILGSVDLVSPAGAKIGTTHYQTSIYGYGTSQATASFPGKTFVIPQNANVNVHWVNNLGTAAKYLLNPYMDHSAMMNTPDMMAMPLNDGVPTVPHLHGGHTESASDGQPDQWFTQALPEKAGGPAVIDRGVDAVKANDTYFYDSSVNSSAKSLWYHDHALGYTRTNVYAGLAGMYFTRDKIDTGTSANTLGLPSGKYEVPLMIADRMFTPEGQLYYPYQVDPTGCVRMLPESFGNVMTVNGKAWPVMHVEQRAYRFRMVNASDSRFLNLWLAKDSDPGLTPAATLTQVGTDQGLLFKPVPQQKMLFAPGERADVVVDFSKLPAGTKLILRNDAATPYAGGDPVDPATTGQVMEFVIDAPLVKSYPNPALKANILPSAIGPLVATAGQAPLQVGLFESDIVETYTVPDTSPGAAPGATTTATYTAIVPQLGTLKTGPLSYHSAVTETIKLNNTAVWEIYNTTADAHPVHLHLVAFQVLSRQAFTTTVDAATGATTYAKTGPVRLPQGNELGMKDIVVCYPGEVTRIIAKFDRAGKYMWHCHILSHEENDMMRPFTVTSTVTPKTVAAAVAAPAAVVAPAVTSSSTMTMPMSGNGGMTTTAQSRSGPTPTSTTVQQGTAAARARALATNADLFRGLARRIGQATKSRTVNGTAAAM
jgi:spore coat protein A